MRGFQLDPNSNDFVLTPGGRMIPIDGADAAAQEILTRLRMFRGEYFLDLRQGVPYYEELLRKGVDVRRVRAIVREVILSVAGITEVISIDIDINRATRRAVIAWTARYEARSTVAADLQIGL